MIGSNYCADDAVKKYPSRVGTCEKEAKEREKERAAESQHNRDTRISRAWVEKRVQLYRAKAEDRSFWVDFYNVPIVGAAVTAVAATAFRTNIDAITGAGIVGAGFAALSAYDHPDTDQTSYLKTYGGLQCIYDSTHSVLSTKYEALLNWRTELRAAKGDMLGKTAKIRASASKDAATVAMQSALKDTQAAADKALETLTNEIAAFTDLSTVIYSNGDKLILASMMVQQRKSQDFGQLMQDLTAKIRAADQNQSNAQDARAKLLSAQDQTTVAKDVATAKSDATLPDTMTQPTGLLTQPTSQAADTTSAVSQVNTPPATNPTPAGPAVDTGPVVVVGSVPAAKPTAVTIQTGTTTPATRDGEQKDQINPDALDQSNEAILAINSALYDPISRLQTVTQQALDAIPSPAYSQMKSDVVTCVADAK
jgi:hypothetical protein